MSHPNRLLLALVLAGTCSAFAQDGDRPANIVLILSDDAGYVDFGFQGALDIETPHLDALAARGVRCTQGYVLASVCSPSRAGLVTGRYPQRFGYYLNLPYSEGHADGLPIDEVTIADRLRALGYRTAVLGKWHLGEQERYHPLVRGFDEFFGCLKGSRSFYPYAEGDKAAVPSRVLRRGRQRVPESAYFTDALGDEAVRFVDANAERPFFLFLSFTAVHTPMEAKPEDLAAFANVTPVRRKKLAAMTKSMDDAVGRLSAALERNGIADNTLVIFLNDNGGATNNASSNGSLRGTKGSPFEGGVRVPFVVSWPGVLPAGTTYDQPVSALDIAPTALEAAGAAEDELTGLEGTDLLPYLRGEREDAPHDVLYWSRREIDVVREGDWKLIRARLSLGDRTWLFDLASDPSERVDRVEDEPERVARMTQLLDTWTAGNAPPAFRGRDSDNESWRRMHLRDMGLDVPNPAATAAPRGEYDGDGWQADPLWLEHHESIVRSAEKLAAEDAAVDLVLLGDSITQAWGDPHRRLVEQGAGARARWFGEWRVHNAAISGDRTQHVLWRLSEGALRGLDPRVVMLMIGTNNVGEDDPEEIAGGIESIVDRLLADHPETQVLLLGVFPRDRGPRGFARRQVHRINEHLPALAERERVHYLDLGEVFVADDGGLRANLYDPDLLHLAADGYEAWGESVAPVLRELSR